MKSRVLICCFGILLGTRVFAQQAGPGSSSQTQFASRAAAEQAMSLEQQGRFADAEAAWRQLVKAQPKSPQAYAHLGLLEARQEHYAEAIALYRKAQTLAQAQKIAIPQLKMNLGLALFKSGNFHEAATVFAAELRREAKTPEAQRLTILVGMSHYGAHQYAEAIPYLQKAKVEDASNLPMRLALAHCYLWTKQFEAVLGVYREILAIDPNSAEADMVAGEALDAKGDNAGAEKQFRLAALANPKEQNVHFGLGYLLWEQKRFDEAIQEFNAELGNDPKDWQAMTYLADSYVQQGRFDDARPVLETLVVQEDGVPLVHLDLGIVEMETGEIDAAAREFERTIALDPANVAAHFRLGRLYRTAGKQEQAKAEFAKASALNRKVDDALYKRMADPGAGRDQP